MSQVVLIHKESKKDYIEGNSYTWCPGCGEPFIMSKEEVEGAIDKGESVYAYCMECGTSFYIEVEDE